MQSRRPLAVLVLALSLLVSEVSQARPSSLEPRLHATTEVRAPGDRDGLIRRLPPWFKRFVARIQEELVGPRP